MPDTSPPRPLPQMTIGLLGGMSDQATADDYRMINARLNAHHGGWDDAEIVIVSASFGNIRHFISRGLWDEAQAYLADKTDRLERAGADVAICASNTMHRVVEPIMAAQATPFIHIVDPERLQAAGRGLPELRGLPQLSHEIVASRSAGRECRPADGGWGTATAASARD